MTGRLRAPLPEVFQFIERKIVAGQVQQRVDQHRTVAGREQKAISIFPLGIVRVVSQKTRPKHVSHRRCAERQSGMAGVCLLNGVE